MTCVNHLADGIRALGPKRYTFSDALEAFETLADLIEDCKELYIFGWDPNVDGHENMKYILMSSTMRNDIMMRCVFEKGKTPDILNEGSELRKARGNRLIVLEVDRKIPYSFKLFDPNHMGSAVELVSPQGDKWYIAKGVVKLNQDYLKVFNSYYLGRQK